MRFPHFEFDFPRFWFWTNLHHVWSSLQIYKPNCGLLCLYKQHYYLLSFKADIADATVHLCEVSTFHRTAARRAEASRSAARWHKEGFRECNCYVTRKERIDRPCSRRPCHQLSSCPCLLHFLFLTEELLQSASRLKLSCRVPFLSSGFRICDTYSFTPPRFIKFGMWKLFTYQGEAKSSIMIAADKIRNNFSIFQDEVNLGSIELQLLPQLGKCWDCSLFYRCLMTAYLGSQQQPAEWQLWIVAASVSACIETAKNAKMPLISVCKFTFISQIVKLMHTQWWKP